MIRTVFVKEVRDILTSSRFALTFAMTAGLLLLGFAAGARSYHEQVAATDAAKRENLKQMEGITDWLSIRQHRIFLPPHPLATLVTGVANDIGRTADVHGRGEPAVTGSLYGQDPSLAVFRVIDLTFLIEILLSLFAVLAGYDAISGEKERGTLRLTFAGTVPRHRFILGKMLGAVVGLGTPLALAFLAGCLLLKILGVPMDADAWMRLLVIAGAGLLYFGAFLALALAVSALTTRSAHSFLALLVLWVVLVLVLPRSAVLLAGRAVEVPTVDQVETQASRYQKQLWEEERTRLQGFRPTTTGDPRAMIEEFQKFMGERADEREKKSSEYLGRLLEERANRQAVQEHLALGLARLSPAATFSLAATHLAGTSLDLQARFRRAAREYQEAYGRFLLAKTGMNPGGGMVVFRLADDSPTPTPVDPREIPEFVYRPTSLAEVFPGALPDLGILAGVALLGFGVAFAAFIRYDVR
jgi:ABC-2 type transport system permease protein